MFNVVFLFLFVLPGLPVVYYVSFGRLITSVLFFLLSFHYVNVSVLIKFSQKTSVLTLIIISSP